MRLRSRLVTITSIYLLLAAALNLYYGFVLFFSGAVALAFSGSSGSSIGGGITDLNIDQPSGWMALLGLYLLIVGVLMIVIAIALYARKEGSRTRTILVSALSIIACILCIINTLSIQWIPLVLSLIVLLLFTFDPRLNRYLQHRSR